MTEVPEHDRLYLTTEEIAEREAETPEQERDRRLELVDVEIDAKLNEIAEAQDALAELTAKRRRITAGR